ncbi:aldo/keto reductase [Pedobacter sp. HDW13]|uniref:aldo/keto reductase n=1 Tax=unclassified Pedobacter TaxID=2628915 RepID=UPI001319E7DC|nr:MULTISPECIES: aldo/keto reductase [unclassified Pedobacter]QIL41342.1 aldo/keto reductase [Pedobacter sp. HDW13]
MSKCVLGTAALGGIWGAIDKEESVSAILLALEYGIEALDTAPAYADAEEIVGTALKKWRGRMPQINTKVGRLKCYATDEGIYDYTPLGMERSVQESLTTLGVEAIDVLFLHDPDAIAQDTDIELVFKQMQKFKQAGYAKKIGIGGNLPDWFKQYDFASIFDVVMEFNRLDACCKDALITSIPYYKANNIQFYSASPLHMGLLGNKYQEFVDTLPVWMDKKSIEKAKQIKKIADKYKLSLPSMAHRFILSIPEDFKMVIGPGNSEQLLKTLFDIQGGALPEQVFKEIMNSDTI